MNCLRQVVAMLLLAVFAAAVSAGPSIPAQAQTPQQEAASQEAPAQPAEAETEVAPPEDAYTEEELDDLVAPVALYPDALLAQVLVAATYPLDVIKAQRWAEANQELADDARADAAQQEGWDPSIAVLAAGFPTVLQKMAAEIDWTEQLGDAVLVQDGDVLDAVQRQRARAAAAGNLETNEAQKVEVQEDQITVTPANPEVVYVPVYDTQTVYTQPATSTTVVKESDDKYSSGDLLATGIIAFGAGMIVNEIFDDDDPYYGYWRGPPPMYWGGGGFRPYPGRGGVNVGGDVNINIDNDGRWNPDRRQRDKAKRNIEQRNVKATDRKGGAQRVADRAGGGQRDAQRPAGRDKAASLESRMKKRETAAAPARAERPANRPAAKNAFAGSKRSGTETRKALNRGGASSKKASIANNRSTRQAAPQRKRPEAAKHKPSGDRKARAGKSQGREHASRGGARERRR